MAVKQKCPIPDCEEGPFTRVLSHVRRAHGKEAVAKAIKLLKTPARDNGAQPGPVNLIGSVDQSFTALFAALETVTKTLKDVQGAVVAERALFQAEFKNLASRWDGIAGAISNVTTEHKERMFAK